MDRSSGLPATDPVGHDHLDLLPALSFLAPGKPKGVVAALGHVQGWRPEGSQQSTQQRRIAEGITAALHKERQTAEPVQVLRSQPLRAGCRG